MAYESLRRFQKSIKHEIERLHDATERFVHTAVREAKTKDKIPHIEKHILDIGKNIDELEHMLFNLSLKK